MKEKRSRSETTSIYESLGAALLEGVRDRDVILDETIRVRKYYKFHPTK